MPKKSMELLTESMFYVLLAFQKGPQCGIELSETIQQISGGRVRLGPATMYTILGKFESEKYIREVSTEGRKRTYTLTARGQSAYDSEFMRLQHCIFDAELIRKENSYED